MSIDSGRCKRVDPLPWLTAAVVATAIAAMACTEVTAPPDVEAAAEMTVEAVGMKSVRVAWMPVDHRDVSRYRIERRQDFKGEWNSVAEVPQETPGPLVHVDNSLQPESFYGYRVITVTRFGDESEPSTVRGVKTPPLPGVEVSTTSIQEGLRTKAIDANGYLLRLRGPSGPTSLPIAPEGRVVFSPLDPGNYSLEIADVASNCELQAVTLNGIFHPPQFSVAVPVTDEGVQTRTPVHYEISCRDPELGQLIVEVSTSGDSLDTGYDFTLAGVARENDSTVVIADERRLNSPSGSVRFNNLLPGDYHVAIEDVEPNCAVDGELEREFTTRALGSDTVRYEVACQGAVEDSLANPYILVHEWRPTQAPTGETVAVELSLDLTANADRYVAMAEGSFQFDPDVVEYSSDEAGSLGGGDGIWTVNAQTPGLVVWQAIQPADSLNGDVGIGRIIFEVVGGNGDSTRTRGAAGVIADSDLKSFSDSVRVKDDTLTVGAGVPLNQAPVAEANGPYSGTAGKDISFTASGSTDPDGSVQSYSWEFGDGNTATGELVSHAYASPGDYWSVLTVTDDIGATDSDSAQVTVTDASGNQAPLANANGPYQGAAGQEIVFSSAGSSDPDGSIDTYAWSFGDGQTGSGPSPTHIYQDAGSYEVVLTITDDDGATADDTADVTVTSSGGGGDEFYLLNTWIPGTAQTGEFVALSLDLDLTADASQEVGSAEGTLRYDETVVTYDSVDAGVLDDVFTVNSGTAGQVIWSAVTTDFGSPPTGNVNLATFYFTVVGADGRQAATVTELGAVADLNLTQFDDQIVVVEDTLSVGAAVQNQAPVADAGGPYGGNVGEALSFDGSGSTDTDGTIATYSWDFGDGDAGSGESVTHTYAAAGTYTATLTVTDDDGATANSTAQVSVTAVGQEFTWVNDFGEVEGDSVALAITLDLTTNISETPGVEQLYECADTLRWDPGVLEYRGVDFTPALVASRWESGVSTGVLRFWKRQSSMANTGVVQIALVWFRVVGSEGATTNTITGLSEVEGTEATGSFDYLPRTTVTEATFTVPSTP